MDAILIRYGELFLKGNNRYIFENKLRDNINKALNKINSELYKTGGRFVVENFNQSDEKSIIDRLTKVFGIHSISPAVKIKTDIELIRETALKLAPEKGTFKVFVNRADKTFYLTSMETAREVGAYILQYRPQLTVDVVRPKSEIHIDIREKGVTYVLSEKIPGQGGMPVGTAGAGLLLLSGGIDSPTAGYMMAKRGMKIHALHFHSYPYTSDRAKQKVIELAEIISAYTGEIELNIISVTDIQQQIHMKCPKEYMITILRRFMLRLAAKVAEKINSRALITGESLGQVASQTVESIDVISSAINLNIFRPLIGLDKSEIIGIAERIGTYEKSIEPYEDCCTVFLPKNPVIKPKLKYILEAEAALDADALADQAYNTLETVLIGS
ncbi:MAG: tRNA uracil 4-sulfurtransferase ThiI [Christensenellales bacterium]|jgi:thiamine biosynthesis protein ThiI